MHLATYTHTYTLHSKFKIRYECPSAEGTINIPRLDCSTGINHKCLDTPLYFSSLTSTTFAVLDLIFNL
ncbi:hypothetical protein E2C01_025565 [Portunus trituberculatus]|uniref:Uncharacterized protein n=1 Tax=Portunus trituberculatus TaxID=210409 RepID=A0A5B7EG24_PORTR|nr:hypothetical protein [Portunus trituberculatus]